MEKNPFWGPDSTIRYPVRVPGPVTKCVVSLFLPATRVPVLKVDRILQFANSKTTYLRSACFLTVRLPKVELFANHLRQFSDGLLWGVGEIGRHTVRLLNENREKKR